MLSRGLTSFWSSRSRFFRYTCYGTATALTLSVGAVYSLLPPSPPSSPPSIKLKYSADDEIPLSDIPTRDQQIKSLKSPDKLYDILVIGGGATGAGIALDGITRGMNVALVERDDFCSGTSSRSTKLIHGGVRYLEKAFKSFDKGQLHLVTEALAERRHLLSIAPHLSHALPTIVPLYHPFPEILFYAPYYYIGTKLYDLFAGEKGILEPSYWISRREARDKFPLLKEKGLKGGVVYYDGQQNDSRMCLSIILTAAAYGANVANHTEVTKLIEENGRIVGAKVRDLLSGDSWEIRAKHVINATGPFSDSIRKMARPDLKNIIQPSSGVHVILSNRYCPSSMGLIIPKTTDGRVLFLLPWEGATLAGTTDSSTEITALPRPHENEIKFIIDEVSRYLSRPIHREDVDAAWSGIRPLAIDTNAKDTASTSRDHLIECTAPGLITIAGGKWTTYRRMAEDTINKVLEENNKLKEQVMNNNNNTNNNTNNNNLSSLSKYIIDDSRLLPCVSTQVMLIGAGGYSVQQPSILHRMGFSSDIADHLSHNYGDKAAIIARIAEEEHTDGRLNLRLSEGYSFIEAEVLYGVRYEMAMTAIDLLSNRIRLAFLNSDAALQSLPRIISLMAKELGWDNNRKIIEYQRSVQFLHTMNRRGRKKNFSHSERVKRRQIENNIRNFFDNKGPLNDENIDRLRKIFKKYDTDHDDYITRNDIQSLLSNEEIFGSEIIKQLKSGQIPRIVKVFLSHIDYHLIIDSDDGGAKTEYIGIEEFLFSIAAAINAVKHADVTKK